MSRRPLPLVLLLAALIPGADAAAQNAGVVLYEGTRLTGSRIDLTRDVFDLDETSFGSRRARSVAVAPGCRATLFELSGYRGASVEVTGRVDDLSATRLGARAVASARVDCAGARIGTTSAPWGAGVRGVTLFRDAGFRGDSETFSTDVPDLSRTRVGARQASSVDVPDGCVAVLFSGTGFSGRSTELRKSHDNLRLAEIGNDTVASLRVDCRGTGGSTIDSGWSVGGRGVTLYRDSGFKGDSETFSTDVPDLSRTRVGARQASSIEVPEGCTAELFTGTGFSGRSTVFREAHDHLRLTDVGNDAAASLRVDCRSTYGPTTGGRGRGGTGRGVTLYRDSGFKGDSETFSTDVPDLSRTRVGARQASSIEVPEGCTAELFTGTGFSGRSTVFREAHDHLRLTDIGNDTASSLRVDCGRRRFRPGSGRTPGNGSAGVTLFRDKDFDGEAESFRSDVPDLSRTRVGGRQASSIEVPAGCRVTLFSEPGYRGRSATFDADHDDLRQTPIGNDAAQSMRVDCGSTRW
jgi:hypothetical protein